MASSHGDHIKVLVMRTQLPQNSRTAPWYGWIGRFVHELPAFQWACGFQLNPERYHDMRYSCVKRNNLLLSSTSAIKLSLTMCTAGTTSGSCWITGPPFGPRVHWSDHPPRAGGRTFLPTLKIHFSSRLMNSKTIAAISVAGSSSVVGKKD